jgi:hypothetical protein
MKIDQSARELLGNVQRVLDAERALVAQRRLIDGFEDDGARALIDNADQPKLIDLTKRSRRVCDHRFHAVTFSKPEKAYRAARAISFASSAPSLVERVCETMYLGSVQRLASRFRSMSTSESRSIPADSFRSSLPRFTFLAAFYSSYCDGAPDAP